MADFIVSTSLDKDIRVSEISSLSLDEIVTLRAELAEALEDMGGKIQRARSGDAGPPDPKWLRSILTKYRTYKRACAVTGAAVNTRNRRLAAEKEAVRQREQTKRLAIEAERQLAMRQMQHAEFQQLVKRELGDPKYMRLWDRAGELARRKAEGEP